MKNVFLLSLLLLISSSLCAQIGEECYDLKLESKEQIAASEPCALELSNFILSQPLDIKDKRQEVRLLTAIQQLMAWMEKTHRSFALNPMITDISTKIDRSLFTVHLACLAKAGLEHSAEEAPERALAHFVRYVQDKEMRVPQKRPIKLLLKAWEAEDYEAYL